MTDIGKHTTIVEDLKLWIHGLLLATKLDMGGEAHRLRMSL